MRGSGGRCDAGFSGLCAWLTRAWLPISSIAASTAGAKGERLEARAHVGRTYLVGTATKLGAWRRSDLRSQQGQEPRSGPCRQTHVHPLRQPITGPWGPFLGVFLSFCPAFCPASPQDKHLPHRHPHLRLGFSSTPPRTTTEKTQSQARSHQCDPSIVFGGGCGGDGHAGSVDCDCDFWTWRWPPEESWEVTAQRQKNRMNK